jgi:hypothetical protein
LSVVYSLGTIPYQLNFYVLTAYYSRELDVSLQEIHNRFFI